MPPYNGYWLVLETRQGGGIPDTLYGPFWDHREALTVARTKLLDAKNVGRADRYQVAYAETDPEVWE